MSGPALALVLTAALLHAAWNLTAKRVRGDGYAFVWWYTLVATACWLPVGLVLLGRAGWPWSWGLLVGPAVSGLLHITYGLSLQTGYDRADLGVVYPVARGVGPLLSMLVAVVILGERPGWAGVLGGVVVIAGIVVVTTASGARDRARAGTGLAWGSLTGATIAAYTLWDDHSVTTLALQPVIYFAASCAWQVAFMTPALRRRTSDGPVDVLRRWWREIATVGLLSPLAYILVLQAMRTTPVALVAPARETSIIVGSLLGCWLFGEPHPVRKVAGAVVVLTGIALIVV